MKSVAVFCGSQSGNNPLFELHARETAALLARSGYTIIYGGGGRGLMGAVANAALDAGGRVIGVIPEHLRSREHQHGRLTELHVVPDMHTRKKMMYELSGAAIILPGGFGSMDELFEMLTWNQLTIHDKRIFMLNTAGYYNHLFAMMTTMQDQGFLYDRVEDRISMFDQPQALTASLTGMA